MTLNELYSLYPNLQQKFEEFESREYVSIKEIKECLFNLGVKELFKNFNKKSFRIREDLNEIFIKISQLIHKSKYNYSNTIFKNSTEKTKIICNSCGTELSISFTNHINGKGGCRRCGNTLDQKDFILRSSKIHNNKYDYSQVVYKNLYKPIKIICPIHGEFYQNPSNHLAGCGCQKCHPQKRRRTNEEFIKEAIEIHGDKYDYSKVDYKDCYNRVEIICPKHGVFWQRPVEHINKNKANGCPKCGYNRKTNKEFIDIANKLHGNKYTYDIEYTDEKFISTAEKIGIICPIHGLFYQSAGNHIYEGTRSKEPNGCPKCAPLKSKTEERIGRFLKKNNILYQSQKIFIGCFYKNALRFDFYLPDYNLCIEYQGEQHFKCIDYFGGEENFKKSLERDSIKRKYCEENNIFLLEIPYNIGNIDDVNSYILYVLKNIEEKNIFEYDISNWRLSRQFE